MNFFFTKTPELPIYTQLFMSRVEVSMFDPTRKHNTNPTWVFFGLWLGLNGFGS